VTADEEPSGPDNVSILLRFLPAIAVHARAAVEAGDGALAEKDLHVLTKFETGLLQVGRLYSLGHAATARRAQLEVLRQGIKRHLWTNAQLEALAAGSDPAAVWPFVRTTLAIERYTVCQELLLAPPGTIHFTVRSGGGAEFGTPLDRMGDVYVRHFPEGIVQRLCAEMSRKYSRSLDALRIAVPPEGWSPYLKKLSSALEAERYLVIPRRSLHSNWDARRFIVIVCALERHYLAKNRYPAALTGISPPLPAELLPDTDGQPLRYRTAADGVTFQLRSVGWDCKDNTRAKNDDDVICSTE
jgi:hypothetical protein